MARGKLKNGRHLAQRHGSRHYFNYYFNFVSFGPSVFNALSRKKLPDSHTSGSRSSILYRLVVKPLTLVCSIDLNVSLSNKWTKMGFPVFLANLRHRNPLKFIINYYSKLTAVAATLTGLDRFFSLDVAACLRPSCDAIIGLADATIITTIKPTTITTTNSTIITIKATTRAEFHASEHEPTITIMRKQQQQ